MRMSMSVSTRLLIALCDDHSDLGMALAALRSIGASEVRSLASISAAADLVTLDRAPELIIFGAVVKILSGPLNNNEQSALPRIEGSRWESLS